MQIVEPTKLTFICLSQNISLSLISTERSLAFVFMAQYRRLLFHIYINTRNFMCSFFVFSLKFFRTTIWLLSTRYIGSMYYCIGANGWHSTGITNNSKQ